MRDLTVEQLKILPVNKSSAHLSPIQSHLHCFGKLLTCRDDDHNILITVIAWQVTFACYKLYCHHNTHVLRQKTITPEGSPKHFWNAPQDTQHSNQIWKSWQMTSLSLKTHLPWILHHRITLCWRETMVLLINTVNKMTISGPSLTY